MLACFGQLSTGGVVRVSFLAENLVRGGEVLHEGREPTVQRVDVVAGHVQPVARLGVRTLFAKKRAFGSFDLELHGRVFVRQLAVFFMLEAEVFAGRVELEPEPVQVGRGRFERLVGVAGIAEDREGVRNRGGDRACHGGGEHQAPEAGLALPVMELPDLVTRLHSPDRARVDRVRNRRLKRFANLDGQLRERRRGVGDEILVAKANHSGPVPPGRAESEQHPAVFSLHVLEKGLAPRHRPDDRALLAAFGAVAESFQMNIIGVVEPRHQDIERMPRQRDDADPEPIEPGGEAGPRRPVNLDHAARGQILPVHLVRPVHGDLLESVERREQAPDPRVARARRADHGQSKRRLVLARHPYLPKDESPRNRESSGNHDSVPGSGILHAPDSLENEGRAGRNNGRQERREDSVGEHLLNR